ncbi:hypothetical protein HAX54_033811 [Datura stramonium]|uniref:Uncharacterized protein n=1 Tax=Datura stramonium TaxID=4076 RepID=A0ABS8SDR0_DATST|nr:hypothetical protein [Datura stramonium]
MGKLFSDLIIFRVFRAWVSLGIAPYILESVVMRFYGCASPRIPISEPGWNAGYKANGKVARCREQSLGVHKGLQGLIKDYEGYKMGKRIKGWKTLEPMEFLKIG